MNSKVCIALFVVFAAISGIQGQANCSIGYTPVGEKCYSVPGLPFYLNWWQGAELCALSRGQHFHTNTRQEWDELNDFLINVLEYTDDYWTDVSAEGHPGDWVIRSNGQLLDVNAVEFKAGAPSNSPSKLCLMIEYQRDLGRYQWVDIECDFNRVVVVCEPRCR